MIRSLLLVSLVFLARNIGAQELDYKAFVNVTIIPMTDEKPASNQTVLIEGGLIKKIGNSGSFELPKGTEKIDGKGKFLMPGLSDMHVHIFSEDELFLYLANGVTTVRNLWGWQNHLEWKRKIGTGAMIGPTLYTSGRIIDGKPAKLRGSAEVNTYTQVIEEVSKQAEEGYDFIKVYDNLQAPYYAMIATEAKKRNLQFVGHVPENVGLYSVLLAGQATIEHLDGFLEVASIDSVVSWQSKLDNSRLIESAKTTYEVNAFVTPTLLVYERGDMSAKESEEFLTDAILDYLPAFYKRFCCGSSYDAEDDLDQKVRQERTNNRLQIVRTLHEQGVNLLLGTDTGNRFVLPGFDISNELELLVAAGLTPFEALKTATVNPAKHLGTFERTGTIEVGKVADLILLESNPLEDLTTLEKPIGVMTKGSWLSRKAIDKKLLELKNKQKK